MNTFVVPPNRRFVRESRPLDFIYDPVYTAPAKTDFYKHAAVATRFADSKLQLRPNFPAFFSDVSKDARVETCLQPKSPSYMEKFIPSYNIEGTPVYPMAVGPPYPREEDVAGADRAKYFIKYTADAVNVNRYRLAPTTTEMKNKRARALLFASSADEREQQQRQQQQRTIPKRSRGTQTDYREMETQTDPYTPDYVLSSSDQYPKVLALIKMTWGKGLPATLDDILTIERALTRRLVDISDQDKVEKKDFVKRVKLMEKLEAQQWKDRERELDRIRAFKSEVARKQLQDLKQKMTKDQTARLEQTFQKKKLETGEKLQQIKLQYLRQLRKLERKYNSGPRTFKRDIILDYIDMESSIYAPLARRGPNIDQLGSAPDYQFTVHRDFETLSYLTEMDSFVSKHLTFDLKDFSKTIKNIRPKRSVQTLEKQLQECFEAFRDVCKPKAEGGDDEVLNSMIMKSVRRLSTPEKEIVCEEDHDDEEAIIVLQTLIRGRAVQSLLRQEAENNMDMILQVKDAYKRDPFGTLQPIGEKLAIRQQQREQEASVTQSNEVSELIEQVEGEVLSHMMSFLEKEMTRLLDERKIHALILLAERERRMQEASEGGKRQKEEDCLRANDEVWRQVVGVHQQTIDMYLEDIYLESVHRTADEGARKHVQNLARTVNDAAYVLEKNIESQDKDEIASDLVHSFVFPQVKRENIQREMLDIRGRYYSVATQITSSLLNSKGVVQEVLDVIGPELEQRFKEGAEVVCGSYQAVEQMIQAAVEQAIARKTGGSSLVTSSSEAKEGIPEETLSDSDSDDLHLAEAEEGSIGLPEPKSKSTSKALISKAQSSSSVKSSKGKGESRSVLKSVSHSDVSSKLELANPDQNEEEEEDGKGPEKNIPEIKVTLSEQHVSEGEGEVSKVGSRTTSDKEIEVKPRDLKSKTSKREPETAIGETTTSIVPSEKDLPDLEKGTSSFIEVQEEESLATSAESENKGPWDIPISVHPELSDLIGLKMMELQHANHELSETTHKAFEAACISVGEVFQGVQDCFTQSDDESDQELDDEDPDQD